MASLLPQVTVSVTDGGLGVQGSGASTAPSFIGYASGASALQFYSFGSLETARDTLRSGPLAEAVAYALTVAGGPVFAVGVPATTAGVLTAGATARAAGSPSTGFVSASGTASATQTVVLKISSATPDLISGGAVMVQTSTDGGATFGTAAAIPGTGLVVVAGITFKFVGLFFQNDTFRASLVSGASLTSPPIASHATGPVSTGTVTPSGTPHDTYGAKVEIVSAGIVEAGNAIKFKYSLDNGVSYSAPLLCPGSGVYVLPDTGITLTFAGFFNTGDVVSFTTVAPGYTLSDAQAALDVLSAAPVNPSTTMFVGSPTAATTALAATAGASFAAGVQSLMVGKFAAFKYMRGYVEAPEASMAELISSYQSVTGERLSVGAGSADLISSLTSRTIRVNAQLLNVARMSSTPISEYSHRVGAGGLTGVTKIYHDEQLTPGLDAARFVTLRTHPGLNGFYITKPRTFAGPSSDYQQSPNCRVMDVACQTARIALLDYVGDSFRTNAATGAIDEAAALAIEARVNAVLAAQLYATPDVTAVSIKIDRAWNILSTEQLKVQIRITPLGVANEILLDIGMRNPALPA